MKPMFSDNLEFCSNFYPSVIEMYGKQYPTVEHAYQAAKCLNPIERKEICNARTPGEAKFLGRNVIIRPDWENVKLDVMYTLVQRKFQIPVFRELLTSTENTILIETNHWHDNFWGDCYCNMCYDIKGRNELGKILMLIRG